MWHALRADLAYFRPWILGAFAIAVGVALLITVIFSVVGEDGPPDHAAAGMRGMFLVMAPMIVAFIAQGIRSEERRARLLLAGPLTPRQIGGAMVLLPAVLFGIGVVAAALTIVVEAVITRRFNPESLNMAGFVGGQMIAYSILGLLIQEAAAARNQRRSRAAVLAWSIVVASALVLAAMYVFLSWEVLTWVHLVGTHLLVAVAAMAGTTALYSGRTDFTK